ncbi:sulfotransferase [Planctomycetota bacterium]
MVQELRSNTYITIRYENLCRNPKETLRKIYDFLGLNVDTVDLKIRSSEHHIFGNQMRLNSTDEITLDERWKKALSTKDLEVFEQTAAGPAETNLNCLSNVCQSITAIVHKKRGISTYAAGQC